MITIRVLHEVQKQYVVKKRVHLLIVLKVDSVMQFCEFQYDLDSLRFVVTRETAMGFTMEDSLATLIYQVRADGIFGPVKGLIVVFLFR